MATNAGPVPRSELPVALTVLTFRRNDLLRDALPVLAAQVRELRVLGHPARLQVVDNDPAGGARVLVDEVAASLADVEVRYAHEPRPGLSAARNRALDEAADVRLLAFIDDDETPSEHWLAAMVATWLADTDAVAVSGPVVSRPVRELDEWARGTGLFDRVRATTGQVRPGIATNNLLLDVARVRELGVRFDARFGLTGGEDSKFGADLRAAGARSIWCDEAEVWEVVPAERLEHDWISKRLTRFGESWVRARVIDLPRGAALRFRATTLARGVVKTGRGETALLVARRRGDERARGRADAELAGGLGLLRGAAGVNREEYARRG